MKKQFLSKSVPRGTRTIWRYLGALFLLFTFAIGNVMAELTAHTPGVYEKTTGEGGYGLTMVSYDPDGAGDSPAKNYEVYYFSWKSSKLYLAAGKSYVTDNTAYCLISNSGTSTTDGIDFGWGNVKCGSLSGSNTSPAAEWAVPASNSSTHYVSLTNSTSLTLKVSGYDQFSFAGRDNHASTAGKQFVVTIDGEAQTFSHSATDQTVYRFDLTTGEHTIVVTGNGTDANRLRCFSLRVPSCDDANASIIANTSVYVNDELDLEFSSDNTNSVVYDIKKGGSATSDASVTAGVFKATVAGTYVVTATQAKDASGHCAVEESVTITVNSKTPVSSVSISGDATAYIGIAKTLTATADQAVSEYKWEVDGVDQGVNAASFNFSASAAGTYSVVCKARNSFNDPGEYIASSAHSITVTKLCGTLVSFTVNGGTSAADLSGILSASATPEVSLTTGSSSKLTVDEVEYTGYKMDKGKYVGVTLTSGSFKAGDVVSFMITTASNMGGGSALYLYDTKTGSNQIATLASSSTGWTDFVLTSATTGVYLYRSNPDNEYPQNPYVAAVKVTRSCETSTDCEIKSLTINGEAITPSAKVYSYEVPALSALTEVAVTYSTHPLATASPASGFKVAVPSAGDPANTQTITVTAEDGTHSDTYTVSVSKAATASDVVTLDALAVTGYTLAPTFDAATLAYTITKAYGTADPTADKVTYTKSEEAQSVDVVYDGTNHKFVVTVTAEDNTTTQDYEITINEAEAPKSLSRVLFSNGFDAFIDNTNHTVKAYYLAGTAAPTATTITAGAGTAGELAEGKITVTGDDASTVDYIVTLAEVTPNTTTVAEADPAGEFAGDEAWVKNGLLIYGNAAGYDGGDGKKWYVNRRLTKGTDPEDDQRVIAGWVRSYFFVGNASKFIMTVGGNNALKYSIDGGDQVANASGTLEIALTKGNHMIEIVSAQNNGDCRLSAPKLVEFPPTYAVTYLAGEGSVKEGQSIPTQEAVEAGTVITLASGDALEKSGYVFNGWLCNIDSEVKNPSAEYTMTAAATTFTAQWLEDNGMAKLYRSDDTPDAGNPYTTLVAAVAAAQDGDKIVLQRNVLDGAGIMLTKDDHKTLTIDFGGYTYTAVSPGVGSAGTQNQAFHLEKNNTVTLKNGTITSSGSEIKMLIQNYCDLTLENIILDGSNLEGSHRYVLSNNCGDVVIGSGTEITAKTGDVAFDVCATNYYPEGVTVTVQDGATISGIVEYDVWGTKPANNQATLAIEGGEFDITWNVESALAEDAKENLNVSAGSFSEAVPVEYCADGYIPAPQDPITNKYTVKEGWKVTFVDGEDVEIVPVDKNTPVAEKAVAGKIGYTFDGWFNGADLYDFAANVTADLMLNAQWTAFAGCADLWPATSGAALNVGDNVDLQTGSAGGSIAVVGMKTAGSSIAYNADGLYFNGGSADIISVTLNNDMTVGTKISVILKSGNTGQRGLTLLNATGGSVAGGTTLGWDDATIGAVETFSYTVTASDGLDGTNVFRLKRSNSVYLQSVRVESCGAAIVYHNVTSEVNIAGKGTVTLGASIVREGYTTTATYSDIDPLYEFVSWSVSGEGASVDNATANPATITVGTEDAVVTLNLQLIPVKFTVNYYDGETPMGTELVAVNENPTASEINTNKRHFTFQGWSETNGGSVVDLNTITSDVAATIDLYADYAPVACPTEGVVFSMEFDNTKAPESTVKVAKNGGSIDLANYATLVGGAAVINNTETSDKDAISTDGKFLLKATKEVMKIELDCAIATGDVIRIPDNNAKYVLSTSDSKTGTYQAQTSSQHDFEATAAWNGVDDLYILYDGSSLNFTKVYVLRPYTVSFDLQGHGDAIDAQKLVEGKKVEEPTAPTADGWDFGGWYKEAACTNAWDFDNDVVDGTMSLFAKWTEHVTNDATLKSLKYGTTAITLVDGTYTYEVELAAAVAAVPALTAETNAALATKLITDATEFVAGQATSTVLVTAEDGATQLLYTVNFTKEAAIELQDVTGNMKWDFSKANDGSAATSNMCNDEVLANVAGIVNNSDFTSDNIKATANKFSSGKLQASMIMFHTTVPGAVIVKFANTGNKSDYRYLVVNGVQTEAKSKDATMVTYAEYVPAGDVVLTVTTANEGNMFNFTSVEFKLDNDLEPYRDDEWLAPGELGTICIPQGAVAVGADIYELVGKEPQYGKIVFETVEHMKPGKPYLFQAKGNRIDFILTDETPATEPDNSGAMKGTFVNLDLIELENVYYFADHALWSCVDLTSLSVPANRAYVKMDLVQELSNPNPAPGRRRITMNVHGEQVVTGVENLNASEQPVKLLINGQIFILRGEKLFDATGRLVK